METIENLKTLRQAQNDTDVSGGATRFFGFVRLRSE
jgi:hypothetical protein